MKLQITMSEDDIQDALTAHIRNAGYPIEGMALKFDFISGRGANSGIRAEIEVSQPTTKVAPAGPTPRAVESVEATVDAEDEAPFETEAKEEAANDEPVEEVSEKKSLFGN